MQRTGKHPSNATKKLPIRAKTIRGNPQIRGKKIYIN